MKKIIIILLLLMSINLSAQIIGRTVQGKDITYTKYGNGPKVVLLMGGIHGRWEKNTVELMKAFNEYYFNNSVNENITLYIIEVINRDSFTVETDLSRSTADGWYEGIRVGTPWYRFNHNYVDLNRNWPTKNWITDIHYGNNSIKPSAGGTVPLSEPETKAVYSFILKLKYQYSDLTIVSYHSYALNHDSNGMAQPAYIYNNDSSITVNEKSLKIAEAYCDVSNYKLVEKWTKYEINGEFINWAGEQNITAIDVELPNNKSIYSSFGETNNYVLNFDAIQVLM